MELMRSRIEAMYVHDERLRMTAVNQWDGGIVPRFYLGRSAYGNLWRFRIDVPDDLAEEIASVCKTEPVSTSLPSNRLRSAPAHQASYVRLLSLHAPVATSSGGPAYKFPERIFPHGPTAVAINQANAHLLRGGLEDWLPDVAYRKPFIAVIEDDHAVAVCASARITATAHEAGVETLPEYRQRGHAARAVSAWAAAVRATGATPFYSTSWENYASQGVARTLGLPMIGTDFHIE